jgi:tetratricopeptide (TPR) repeat protein
VFTGRARELAELDALLPGPGAALAVITGTAGVGKTALAVRWGHRVRYRFPDGQLYVDLRGHDPATAIPPIEALTSLLRALGVPTKQVPSAVRTAADRYRYLLADRRVLVVLDNAADADQVYPLLPAGPGSVALVTSRSPLDGLVTGGRARRLTVGPLAADEALDLLHRLLGHRLHGDRPGGGAATLALACAYLPLALRVAAADLAARPSATVGDHLAALARASAAGPAAGPADGPEDGPEDGPPDGPPDGPADGPRAVLAVAVGALDPGTARVFRLAGLVAGPDVTAEAAGAVADTGTAEARRALNRLTAAHLMARRSPDRYGFHHLVRAYALEGVADGERTAALDRLYAWYLGRAAAAADLLQPDRLRPPGVAPAAPGPFRDHDAALVWLDTERPNLVAAVRRAAADGPREYARQLADALAGYLRLRKHMADWAETARLALAGAEADGDEAGQAAALLSLGGLHHCRHRYAQAAACFEAALAIAGRAGWAEAEAAAMSGLGATHRDAGALRHAVTWNDRALAAYSRLGCPHGEARALGWLGRALHHLGRLADAADCHVRALRTYRAIGVRQGEATALHDLGEVRHAQGRRAEAQAHLTEALALGRRLGDRCNEAYTLRSLAALHRETGRADRAAALARAAVDSARELGDRRAEGLALSAVAAVEGGRGRHREALGHYRDALDLARLTGDRYGEADALLGLAAAARRLRQDGAATGYAERALALARRCGFRILRGRARALLRRPGRPSPARPDETTATGSAGRAGT